MCTQLLRRAPQSGDKAAEQRRAAAALQFLRKRARNRARTQQRANSAACAQLER